MFKRVFPLALAFVLGAVLTWLWDRAPTRDEPSSSVHEAFAQAKAHYLNESNAEYRRARLTLEPQAPLLADTVEFQLDMALIDLQEANHRIQGQRRLIGDGELAELLLSARGHLERARALDPEHEAVAYNLARTYKKLASKADQREQYNDAALRLLAPLAARENADASALLLYGDLLWDAERADEALAMYEKIIALGRDYVSETLYFAAQNKAAKVLLRIDNAAGLARLEAIEQQYGLNKPSITAAAIERGRYTEFVPLAESPKTFPDPRELNWHHVTVRANIPAVGAKPFFFVPDLDGDCARDLVVNGASGMRVLRNLANAQFEDKTRAAGFPVDLEIHAAAAGDLDGDGLCDLVVGGPGGLRLFLNATDAENTPKDWLFVPYDRLPDRLPAFARADEPVTTITLWDFDHDGTLDLFVGGPRNRLYRTTIEAPRTGGKYLRFDEIADKLGFAAPPAHDSLLLDVEEDNDVDLLVTGPEGNAWFENLRGLSFTKRELPDGQGLEAGDVDNDLVEEVRIGRDVYKWTKAGWTKRYARDHLIDLDTDGVIDERPFDGLKLPGAVLQAVGADLNRDDGGGGGRDLLLLTDKGLDLYLSTAQRPMRWIEIRPRGYKTNEMGIGTRLKLWVGDLRIGATCRDGLVSFGIGTRASVDAAVWVRWTNGVEQGVVAPSSLACFDLEEREGEAGSCPFLYAFDGDRWHFINDCHSGTPLGLPYADGKYLPPRSSETIMVPGEKVGAGEDGTVRLDLCEELRELFYVDSVHLRAIDHPMGVRPVLDEGFRVMSHPAFKVFGLGDLRPPRSAVDQDGRDILPLIAKRDGRHAVVWEPLDSRYVGFAHEWSIDLDFGDLSGAARVLLVMDGWVEFPTASSSIAVSRSRTVQFKMPEIEALAPDGSWQKVAVEAGFPAGKGKAALVDLTGKLPGGSGRLRITSTQRLHWDAFGISTGADQPLLLTSIPLVRADHKFRGIGERIDDPALELPWTYSHDRLIEIYAFDQEPGGPYTPYGDVLGWLAEVDDRYPIVAAGDVIELTFDASDLPPLKRGWTRDYCFTTHGWVKDADPNQAVRESVFPLPFRAMSQYPYDPAKEPYPHPDFAKKLTRPAKRLVEANQGPLK